MKKLLSLILLAVMVFACGCGASASKPDENPENPDADFDYYLDKIESYDYYYYLDNPYIYCTRSNVEFGVSFSHQLNLNYRDVGYRITNTMVSYSYNSAGYTRSPTFPVISTKNLKEICDILYIENVFSEIYNIYISDILQESDIYFLERLPRNNYTNIGTLEGSDILHGEVGKIIRIGKNYFEIQEKMEWIEIPEKIFDIPLDTKLDEFMTEKILNRFREGTEGKAKRNIIELSGQGRSIQLTLKKLYSEEQ